MLDQLMDSATTIVSQTKNNMHFLSQLLLVLWTVFFVNIVLGKRLLMLGIRPRQMSGLLGIVCAPFLHANFNHLFFNCIPLMILANFILIQGNPYFLHVTFIIMLISGFLTWCFAKKGIHVGASGVITGYWSLLVSDIYQQGTLTAIILGIVCLYYFAGILFAIFPGEKGVSWQGHLFGFLAGILVSYIPLSFLM